MKDDEGARTQCQQAVLRVKEGEGSEEEVGRKKLD